MTTPFTAVSSAPPSPCAPAPHAMKRLNSASTCKKEEGGARVDFGPLMHTSHVLVLQPTRPSNTSLPTARSMGPLHAKRPPYCIASPSGSAQGELLGGAGACAGFPWLSQTRHTGLAAGQERRSIGGRSLCAKQH